MQVNWQGNPAVVLAIGPVYRTQQFPIPVTGRLGWQNWLVRWHLHYKIPGHRWRTVPKAVVYGLLARIQACFCHRKSQIWHQPKEWVTQKAKTTLSFGHCVLSSMDGPPSHCDVYFFSYFYLAQTWSAETISCPTFNKTLLLFVLVLTNTLLKIERT